MSQPEYGGATVTADKTAFVNNSGGAQGEGGAVQLYSGSDNSSVEGVFNGDTFNGNTAGTANSGQAGQGGAIFTYYYTTLAAASSIQTRRSRQATPPRTAVR